MTDKIPDDGLEELWTLEPKNESSTFAPIATPSPWKLQPFPSLSRRAKRRRRRASPISFLHEYVVGFRGWIVRENHICPVAVGTAWPYCEPLHAQHIGKEDHDAPAAGCMCGTWAFKDPEVAVERFRAYTRGHNVAMGAVAMWGRVFEHKYGYRAEWTYPLTLELYGCSDDTAALLEEAYAVPVKHIARERKRVEPYIDPTDPTSWKLGSGSPFWDQP